jgi:hypothetical protein
MTKTYIKKPKLKFKEGDAVFFLCHITNAPVKGVINSLSVSTRLSDKEYGALVHNFSYHILYQNKQISAQSNTTVPIEQVFSTLEELEKYYDDCIQIDYHIGQDLYNARLEKETIEEIYSCTEIDSKKPYHIRVSTNECCNRLLYEKGEKTMFTLEHFGRALREYNDKNNKND